MREGVREQVQDSAGKGGAGAAGANAHHECRIHNVSKRDYYLAVSCASTPLPACIPFTKPCSPPLPSSSLSSSPASSQPQAHRRRRHPADALALRAVRPQPAVCHAVRRAEMMVMMMGQGQRGGGLQGCARSGNKQGHGLGGYVTASTGL